MSQRTSRTAAAVVAAATAAALAMASTPAVADGPSPAYTFEWPSPVEPGTYSDEFKDANDNGDSVSELIVGDYEHGGPVRVHAELWTADGLTRRLPLLPGDIFGRPVGLNNSRTVVGTSVPSSGSPAHAVRWTSYDTPAELLPLPGDTAASPTAISDNGTAVGTSGTATSTHAVAWPPSGTPVALPPLPGDTESAAVAVNSTGTAVGYSYGAGGITSQRAVAWSPDGTVTALAVPAGYLSSNATRITDSGIVIGRGRPGGPPVAGHALVWNAAGTVADLGPGSTANAVNNTGTVVGGQSGQAARWTVDGTPQPLAPTALEGVATDINDLGVTIGYTSDPPPARAQHYAQLWNADGTLDTLPVWHPSFPYSVPSAITDSGLIVGARILRGNANYGKPLLMRWRP
ncbi:hypothetical protein [Streptomyces sp. CBMA156]|uniref:hypothetical protein n=1 Tax=Streptomyces sp. CBMA156 TaxID=1930280 RepID=UPI001661D5D5|nr:hypothetical protein [Streptomyces sp. CBMA156]MBD0671964.1 hypothetical protein [Streptomyces sp. CBMA156]